MNENGLPENQHRSADEFPLRKETDAAYSETNEKAGEVEINMKDFLFVFLRCLWLMAIVGLVVSIALFAALSLVHVDEFTAEGRLLVKRDSASKSKLESSDITIANNLIEDFKIMVQSPRVQAPVLENHPELTKETLGKMLKVSDDSKSHFIYVDVTSRDPVLARQLVEELMQSVCTVVNDELYEEYVEISSTATVQVKYIEIYDTIIETPQKPSNPVSKIKVLAVAFGSALVVYAVYFVLFLMDDKINDSDDVRKYLGINVLGHIPDADSTHKKKGYGYGYGYYTYYSYGHHSDDAQGRHRHRSKKNDASDHNDPKKEGSEQ